MAATPLSPIHNQLDSFPLIFTRSDEMLVCMVMNSLPLAFEGDLSVAMDKSLARRNVENKSLGAGSQTGAPSLCLTLLGFKSAQIYDLN